MALRTHQKVHVLNYIQEQLISSIFYSLTTPSYLTCHLTCYSSLFLSTSRLDTLLCNKCFQYTSIGILGISEIQQFIQELVNQDKVVFKHFPRLFYQNMLA